jgi:murein DD-endopeptidase MepM/ murein hydrolase activator NlpD
LFQPQLQGAGAQTAAVPAAGASAPLVSLRGEAVPATRSLSWPGIPVGRLRIAKWRQAAAGLAIGTDLATDLGAGIGTPSWWAGLTACLALCATAIGLGTMVPALPQAARAPLTPSQREAMHPQVIAPLALGGRTGAFTRPDPARVIPLADIPERPRIEVSARMDRGRSFAQTLRRAGLSAEDAKAVEALIRPAINPASLAPGTVLDIALGRRETKSVPRPLEQLGFRAAFDLRLAVNRIDGTLALKRIPIKVDSTPLRVTGLVGRSLQASLRSAGIPTSQAREFVRTMGYIIDLQRGVGRNDKFDIIIEQDKAETGEIRHGNLLYGAIDKPAKDRIDFARFAPGRSGGDFFRASGESARKGLMRTPVDGARMTSKFGMRFHPLLNFSRMHQGVDFGARHGSPIYAAASGKADFVGPHGGHGNYVRLAHSGGLKTAYAHMSRFAVKRGQQVSQGQIIGYVGSTGVSTGPHLHYEVWLNGKPVNPMTLKFTGGNQLTGEDMNRFQSELNRLRNLAVTGVDTPAPQRPGRRPA